MSSPLKEFYDKTFNIYQLPVFKNKVLTVEYHDTTGWNQPVRIYETNGSNHSYPTLFEYLKDSPNVDQSTRFRTYSQECDSLHTINSLTHIFSRKPQLGFDETINNIQTYAHNPPQHNELFITNHRTDIEFTPEEISTLIIPKLKSDFTRINHDKNTAPHSIIIWISSTSPTQTPIAETFSYNSNLTNFYIIITPDHEMPQAVSSILPFALPATPPIDRKRHMTTMEFTFETNDPSSSSSLALTDPTTKPHIEHYNNELVTEFTTSTTQISPTLIRITYKFTPKFSRSFYLSIPLTTHSLISLTISDTSFLTRTTIYHLDASTIPLLRSPIIASTKNYTNADVLALYTYFLYYVQPKMPTASSHDHSPPSTLLELQKELESTGIMIKHPEVRDTIHSIISERTSKTSTTEVHYNKLINMFELFTPTPSETNDIYELLPRQVKSFIYKLNLKTIIPKKTVLAVNMYRNYSSVSPTLPPHSFN